MTAGGGRRVSTFESLRVPNYRVYFVGQTLSGVGSWMQNVAIGWLVLSTFHSGAILGAVTASRYAPLVLFGLWGGLVVDRVDTRVLLVITQSAAAAFALGLAAITLRGHVRLAEVFVLVVGIGIVDVFDVPSRQSIISQLVDRRRLGNAIAVAAIATNSARAFGPAVAGGVIAIFGVAPCFIVNSASFVAFIAALLALDTGRLLPRKRETERGGQVRAGLRYVRRTPALLAPLVMVAVTGTLTWEFPVSLPIIAAGTFHEGASAYGFMMAALGAGAVVGSLLAARRQALTSRSLAIFAVAWGLVILAAAAAPTLAVEYVLMVGVGVFAITFNASARTLLQIESVANMRGRVMSLWFMGWQGSTVVGAPLVGLVGNELGGRYALVVGGGAAAAVGAVFLRPEQRPATTSATPIHVADD